MSGFEVTGVVGGSADSHLIGLTSLHHVDLADGSFVLGVGRDRATVLQLSTDGDLQIVSQAALPFEVALGRTVELHVSASPRDSFLIEGGFSGALWGLQLDAGGALRFEPPHPEQPLLSGEVAVLELSGSQHVLTEGAGTLRMYEWADGAIVGPITSLADPRIQGLSELTILQQPSGHLAAAAVDNGSTVAVFEIAQDGSMTLRDTIGALDGVGMSQITQIVPLELDGKTFLLVSAAGSSSLSVFQVGDGGDLSLADHVLDTRETRFESAQILSVASNGPHAFAVAAGADDGISAFRVLPDGRLHHIASIEDTTTIGLKNATALLADVVGSELRVLSSSQAETGVTALTLNLGDLGDVFVGTGSELLGSSGDDVLLGGAWAERLVGQSGDDMIIDGSGADTLIGGIGADTFVFVDDQDHDVVADFQTGIDRIDLSRLPMLFDPAQVEISSIATGAELRFRGDVFEIRSDNNAPIATEALRADIVINLDRPLNLPATQNLLGTDDPDTLIGGDGNDFLQGGRGDDLLLGDDGSDVVSGGEATGPTDVTWYQNDPVPTEDVFDFGVDASFF